MSKDKLKVGKLFRFCELDRAAVDQEARLVELSFSSEVELERWFGIEILDHGRSSVRLDRLKSGGAVLLDHNTRDLVGVVEKVRIEDRRGKATVRISKSARGEEVFQDLVDGIRRWVSVGYLVHKAKLEEERDDAPDVYRVTDWEPLEVSFVSIPADATVGVGRDAGDDVREIEVELPDSREDKKEVREMSDKVLEAAKERKAPEVDVTEVLSQERERSKVIADLGRRFKEPELAEKFIGEGKSVDEFRQVVLDRIDQRGAKSIDPEARPTPDLLGMSDKEVRQFSFFRLVRWLLDKSDGRIAEEAAFERETCISWMKKRGLESRGAFIPPDVFYRAPFLTRDPITVTSEGADLKPTIHDSANFIELLRASRPVTRRARVLTGLSGDVLIPRHATGASAVFATEVAAATETTPTFDQVLLAPNRLAAWTEISRRTMIQFSPDIENLIRTDLINAISEKIEDVAIEGGGTAEPDGIIETSGIGSVTVSGSNIDWEAVVNLEREVDADDALMGSLAYLTSPTVRAAMKRVEIASNTGQFIFDRQTPNAPVNGYPLDVTTMCPTDLGVGDNLAACIFGNFNDLLIAFWDTIELLVNPYSRDKEGIIRIMVNHEADIAIRHPESFAAILDIDPTA